MSSPKNLFTNLTRLQQQIMQVVWHRGEASAREVQAALRRPLAYTTVATLLQRLEKAGWLRHRRAGRTFIYQPAISQEQEARGALRQLLDRMFQGQLGLLVQHWIEREDLTEQDLDDLRRMIDEKRSRKHP